ncbi:DUF5979 domain-containing protein [Microbacterium abyssi]|uniref:DUF5979 domain-containing protein n=1 Tax=Microbacterium abyssi TaxID=2782166 RepID=UPI001889AAEF|nr:DUF5979 domain-containing protein [Microbacterium sp. A18JL241]
MASRTRTRRRGLRALWAATAAIALGMTSAITVGIPVAYAADGDLIPEKTASVTEVAPNQPFSYTIGVSCTSITTGCVNATLTDTVPDAFEILDATIGTGLEGDLTVTGQTVDVAFTMPIANGGQGVPGGTSGSVTIEVRLRPDTPYEANGIPIRNTATTDGDTQTSGPLPSFADVTPVIPLSLATTASKTIDPASAVAAPGQLVTATVTAQNESNALAETMTIVDPIDPTASGNPFETLPFTGLGAVTYPAGADQAQAEVWDGSAWVPGPVVDATEPPTTPGSVDDADVLGVRITFTDTDDSGIAADASASAEIGMEHPDDVGTITDDVTVNNTTRSSVARDGTTASGDASATHQIIAEDIEITTQKSFDPSSVAAGDTSTATIISGNASEFPLTSLTITEPAMTGTDPSVDGFDQSMQFAGFAGPIAYPEGATGATITYYYADGTDEGPLSFADGATPPAPTGGPVRFQIEFTGQIAPDTQVVVPFDVQTDPDQAGYPATITNTATTTGTSTGGAEMSQDGSADLLVYEAHIETTTSKSIYPGAILDRPGEWELVTLNGTIDPFPQTTTDTDMLVVQDPAVVPYPVDATFWDTFDAVAITETAVPADSTLTINYWDGSTWVPLLDENGDAVVVAGPTVFSMDIPAAEQEEILGLQFVYEADEGSSFAAGTTVEPHFTAEVRDTERDPATTTTAPVDIENCAVTSASTADTQSATDGDAIGCANSHLDPYDPDGDGPDVVDKSITPNIVTSRSAADVRAQLNWSTGGLSGVEQVTVQDEAEPGSIADVDQSYYDAFDLVGVDAITTDMDPHLRFDAITAIEIWDGEQWREIANNPCPEACVGGFSGITFVDEDREDALGVRLVFEESEDRADAASGDPTAPPVGSGVARSSGNDRELDLHFQLRDTRRSDGAPAIGALDYNITEDPDDPAVGTVGNTAAVTGTTDGEQLIREEDDATIGIVDVPLNVDTNKTWSNSPFGVPPDGTPTSDFPTGRVTLDATNRTATRVDTLSIADPAPDSPQNPFSYFDLDDIRDIVVPTGAVTDETTVVLSRDSDGDGIADPASATEHTIAEAEALDAAGMTDVVGIVVTFSGRIDPDAASAVVMDLRMREFVRGTSADRVDVDDSPVTNVSEATVADAGGGTAGNTPTDQASAQVEFAELSLDVATQKSFAPDTQTEPDDAPVVMTLTGQPTGSARTQGMRIDDEDTSFWNAFDYVGIDPSFTLTSPINRVQMDVLTGATFTPLGDGILRTGGDWIEGEFLTQADFLTNPLPTGVDPAEVQAIRFTFAQLNDVGEPQQWENPIDPVQNVPVLVQRRADLRTGGEVPSDRSDLEPAPGETAQGEFTNDITTTVCANLQAACAPGEVGVVSATATDTIRYVHATTAVDIVKTPTEGSQYAPATPIPYLISVTNTGQWPIENPVIVDAPTADGQLILDPDAGPEGPYTYTSTTASMPTETDLVDVDESGGDFTFTFPDGSVLEPGETYTIGIDLVIAPGVEGGTEIENTASVSGDRPFDDCNGAAGPVDDCATDTFITVLAAGAVRSGKLVRPIDQELGSFDSNTGEDCAPVDLSAYDPADEGFFATPCVPIAKPGGDVEWRFAIVNTGNIPMDRIVLADLLPTPGDTGVLSGLDRESEWTPLFNGGVELVQAPAGTDWSYQVTTGDVCADDLPQTLSPACADGDWVDPGSAAASDVTGIQVTIDMPTPLEPGGVILVDYDTIAAPYAPGTGPATLTEHPIAWNTVAAGAHLTAAQASGTPDMPPTEGARVGAALATGSLMVEKTVSGDGAEYAPTTFDVQLVCVSAAGTPVETELPPIDLTLSDGEPQEVGGLPWGASCELAEGDNGQTSSTGTGGVIVDPDQPDSPAIQTATLDNVYELAGLEITKTVSSDAVDADGEPIGYGPFEVTVTCTFLGEAVYATGFSADTPMVFEIADGETVTLDGLPAGAECSVAESDTAGAISVTTTGSNANGDVVPGSADGIDIVLTPDDAGHTNDATVDNAFGVGSISILKVIDPADSPFAQGPFVAQAECTLDGDSTWSGDLVFAASEDDPATPDDDTDLEATIDDIAAGSECIITETEDGFATSSTVSPGTVTVPLDDVVTVTITNVFAEGAVTVTKLFEGDTRWADSSYDVTIRCVDRTSEDLIVTIPGGATRALTEENSWTTTYDPLPSGALCAIEETDAGNAASSQILDENGDPVGIWQVGTDDARAFTVVNSFEVGSIEVTKATSGAGADLWGTSPFSVHLECTAAIDGVATVIDIPGGADRVLQVTTDPATATTTYEALPPGAECVVTETDSGGASDVVMDPADGAVTVGDATEPVTVAIDNVFDVGEIVVEKTITGDGEQWATGDFQVSLVCTWNGAAIDIPGGETRTLSRTAGLSTTYEDLPDGALCQVSETDAANASETTLSPDDGVVTVEPGAAVTVDVENRFDTGAIVVDKQVAGPGADLGSTTFLVQLTCDWTLQGETIQLDVPGTAIRRLSEGNGFTTIYEGLPDGAVCTLVEQYDGGAGSTTLSPADGVVTVEENASVSIDVINTFQAGSLELRKVLDGSGAEYFGGGPFTLHVTCTLDDGRPIPRTVYDEGVMLGGDDPLDATIDGIPTGSVCAVEETDDGVADSQSIDGSPATIGDGDVVTVTATNTFLTGSLVVSKTVTGSGASTRGTGPFEVTVQCIDPASGRELVEIPGGAVRVLDEGNDYRTEYEILPAGALCGIAETDDGGADEKRLLDASGDEIGLITLDSGSRVGFFLVRADVELDFELENIFHALPATGMNGTVLWVGGLVGIALLSVGGLIFAVVRRRSGRA